ncbi:MAG: hypothetical protein ABI346_02145 [Candidatus Baltobacteraceae bacterium]
MSGWSGKLNAFAYVQSSPQVMYIGGGWGNTPRESPSQAGIYRTADGGKTWTASDNGLTNRDGTISSVVNGLWLDQAHPSVVLAATEFGGTFRSTDGGNSWKNVDRSEATQFAKAGPTVLVASQRGVLGSNDDGATWKVSLALPTGATTVGNAGSATYAGSTAGDVYRLSRGSWVKTGHPGTGAVHDLAVDPFNAKIVYANVDDKRAWNQNLYGSIDGGKTWKRIACNCSIGAQAIAFSNVTKDRLYLGDDGSGVVFYFTADGNPNPVLQFGAQPYGVDMRYIFPVPGPDKTDDACFLAEDQGLYYASHCSSGTAPGVSGSVPDTLAYDVSVPPGGSNVAVPLQDMGSALTKNGGATWFGVNNTGEGAESTINPYAPQNCYIVHPDNGLNVSSDGCGSFPGYTGVPIESLAFERANASTIYAVTDADTASAVVALSVNGGESFAPTGWRFTNPYQVVTSPKDPNTFLVATGAPKGPNALSYSHDGGATWHAASGLPTTRELYPNGEYFPTHRFYAAFDQNASGTVLLLDHDPATDNIMLYRSTNNGARFRLVSTVVQPIPPRHWPNLRFPLDDEHRAPELPYYATRFYGNRLAFNPQATKSAVPVVVLTTRFGAFASSDVGSHWTRIDQMSIAHHFIGVTWDNGYVYLASFGQGVIKSSAPLQ